MGKGIDQESKEMVAAIAVIFFLMTELIMYSVLMISFPDRICDGELA